MVVPYKLFYRLGFHPWEDLAEHPPFAEKLSELVEREESGREPPYGRALDLGCGSAVWGVKLAERGWQVTGIDLVDKSLERARERVREAGVEMRVTQGDVTDLRDTDVGSGFRLVLDTGTFHGLNADQRAAMGREMDAVAADDATVLLDCFAPRRRGPLPRGASRGRRGGVSRLDDHGHRGRGHRAGPDRKVSQVRRTLLPAGSNVRRGAAGLSE